ncbi:MAG: hypothetical protein ABI612_18880 [Betaproteobacteria bacterium]
MYKINWFLASAAACIAAYAVYAISVDDLITLYRWSGSGPARTTRSLHLHGWWAIAGSICFLLGAVGLAIRSVELRNAKRGAGPYRMLANALIAVGALFFLGVSIFTQWFI